MGSQGSLDDTEATAGPLPPELRSCHQGKGPGPEPPKPGPRLGLLLGETARGTWRTPDLLTRAAAPPAPSGGVPGWAGPAPQGERGWGADQLKSKPPLPAPPRRAPAAPPRTSSFVTMFFQSGEANCPIRAGASGFHLCRRLINMLLLAAADKFQKQVVKAFCLYPAWKMRGVTSREHE